MTAAEVGQQLKAAFVLSGSIRRAGTRLRISSQLVDTQNESLVWSERYDREMADVFEIQDEIARKIAQAAGSRAVRRRHLPARRRHG